MAKPRQTLALVLQGGGALGAYQAGAYARLHEAGMVPAHVAGTSIGAINAAIIAGNTPERRVEHLRIFWERVTAATDWPIPPSGLFAAELSALWGVPGFFSPRVPPATFAPFGNPGRASYYDTAPLRQTLCELVNFDLLNKGPVRLSVSAVEVATGNFSWFDTMHQRLEPEHIMASGALPPGFPPVEIEGRFYWDGGLVSNTPLSHVIDTREDASPLIVWQIDLFSARGAVPSSIWQVEAREKDIRYSSRTRTVTDRLHERLQLAATLAAHRGQLPEVLAADPAIRALIDGPASGPLTLIHLIYRAKPTETGARDYEFSRAAMEAHWAAGHRDASMSLSHPDMVAHDADRPGMTVFDPTRETVSYAKDRTT